ncbi:MAG: ubiquinone/menaquinone biosynthesis C-methylase UbiE [Cellvibrionaceae bacterium]|jgi:ubiquinone/menaquinone biosynthesis C-methylase UbiE
MNVNVIEGKVISIPFPDDSLDVVYSFKVLPRVIEIDKAISKISRALRNDGVAVLEFHNPVSLKVLANKLAGALKKVYTTYHSPKQVKSTVSQHFKIKKVICARIIRPFAYVHKIPVLSTVIKFIEKALSILFMAKHSSVTISTGLI